MPRKEKESVSPRVPWHLQRAEAAKNAGLLTPEQYREQELAARHLQSDGQDNRPPTAHQPVLAS